MVQYRKRRHLWWVDYPANSCWHGANRELADAKRYMDSVIKEITNSYNIPRISNEVTLEL